MIPVETAQELILKNIPRNDTVSLPLKKACGRFLSEDIFSSLPLPVFDNSAMDGYALRSEDTLEAKSQEPLKFIVVGTSSAGTPYEGPLQKFQAVRILTGALVPPMADTVIKQEDIVFTGTQIKISQRLVPGQNIRRQGEEIKQNDMALPAHSYLNPASLGLLASLGLSQVPVFESPKVGILVTGSELAPQGRPLKRGEIYDSNSYSLLGALQELKLTPVFYDHGSDQKDILLKKISQGFEEADFLIVTGGVSVGDFDFVRGVGKDLGIEEIFWQVKQKPGKPLYFGRRFDGKTLFGLPGNPASVLVCFFEYVRPALLQSMGSKHPFLPRMLCPLKEALQNKTSRMQFLRGILEPSPGGIRVGLESHQGSHMMNSFARAHCLVVLKPDRGYQAGEKIEIDLLPASFGNPWGGLS